MDFLPKDSEKDKYSSGQALLIILLAMAVVLTVVLSIFSRSVTDVAVTTRTEESLRAFSAAEAGVERALVVGSDVSGQIGDAFFDATVSSYAEGTQAFVLPGSYFSGEVGTIWFMSHLPDNNLYCAPMVGYPCFTGDQIRVCWGKSGTDPNSTATPAIEISVVYADPAGNSYADLKTGRVTADPYQARREVGVGGDPRNNFTAPDGGPCTIDGETFQFRKTIDFRDSPSGLNIATRNQPSGLQWARVTLLYNMTASHKIGVEVVDGGVFPSQGTKIDSLGTAGDAGRRTLVLQGYPEPPPMFNYGLFTYGSITK